MSSVKVALGIFWDIENCPVPLNKSSSSVAKHIRDFIAAKHPECGYAKEFTCVCDVRRVDPRISDGLNKNGVFVAHVNGTAKNAADDMLQEKIDLFIERYGGINSAVLCVITGDINFAKSIRSALRKDLDVVLIHGQSYSTDLRNLVSEDYFFDEVIGGAESLVMAKVEAPEMPVYLEVTNLPPFTDHNLNGIVGRLSHLSANCGGKPGNVSNGKALIKFGCRDDAQRCLQRINGEDVFGRKIVVNFLNGDSKAVPPKARHFTKQKSAEQTTTKPNLRSTSYKLKNKTLSQQNLATNGAKSETDLRKVGTSQGTDDQSCQSVIIGVALKKGIDVKTWVKSIVSGWNDKTISPELILNASAPVTRKTSRDGRPVPIHVTAISAVANRLLVTGSKKYLKGSGIKWYFENQKQKESTSLTNTPLKTKNEKSQPVSTDCLSVIKGIDTTKDENVAKMVRKVVESWNDKTVQPNYIKTVERDRKFGDKDGTVLLFVSTHNAEQTDKLVAAAQLYLQAFDPTLSWTYYQRKRNLSKETDTASNISDFELISSICSSTQDLSKSKSTQKWTIKPPNDTTCSTISPQMLPGLQFVVTGLDIKKGEKVAKIIRKIIVDWNCPQLNGNMIKSVERFPGFTDTDGKIPLLVTAISPSHCDKLIAGAEQHPMPGIIWAHYKDSSPMDELKESTVIPKQPLSPILPKIDLKSNITEPVPKPLPRTIKMEATSQPISTEAITGVSVKATADNCPVEEPKPIPLAAVSPPPIQLFKRGTDLPNGVVYKPETFSLSLNSSQKSVTSIATNDSQRTVIYPTLVAQPERHTDKYKENASDLKTLKSMISSFGESIGLFKKSPSKSSLVEPKPLNRELFSVSFLNSLTPDYNPTFPYYRLFPSGGPAIGFTVCINGRLNSGADCFTIDFIAKTDIAFHFNVRYKQLLVVRNSYIGCWGPEERETPGFPFVAGHAFQVLVRIERDKYVVAVNGQQYCDYEHRVAVESVTKLHITGDISVHCIRSN